MAPRPFSPPPIPANHKMNLGYLVLPSRRASMPSLYLNARLGSPMRLASPRPRNTDCTPTSCDATMETDDDLDFCCQGYDSPAALPASRTPRPSHLFSPYRRSSSAAAAVGAVSQLGKRRGKMVPSLKLR